MIRARVCFNLHHLMPHRIVITGAPASGKSKFVQRLKTNFHFADFVFFDELARQLLEEDPTYRSRWAKWHQDIYYRQVAREDAVAGKSFITDRGTADAFAFHPETAAVCGTTIENEYKRYNAVILLKSSAALGEKYYRQDEIRTESAAEVLAIEKATIEVWKGHGHFHIIKAETDPELKYTRLVETLLHLIRNC